jgi:Domain of unknown function (DUF4202)
VTTVHDPFLDICVRAIDAANANDPASLFFEGAFHPQALLEGQRAQAWVEQLRPGANPALRLAARAHHLRRWEIPRDAYPRTRAGYLSWRRRLYDFHADALAEIMTAAGYPPDQTARAGTILHKQGLHTDADVQAHEDAVSLAFLELRAAGFSTTVSREQLLRALRRTWSKMSEAGRSASQSLDLSPELQSALVSALSDE